MEYDNGLYKWNIMEYTNGVYQYIMESDNGAQKSNMTFLNISMEYDNGI